LKLLKSQGYQAKNAKELMKNIGQGMAEHDYKSEAKKDPSVLIEQYTEGDKWFATFAVSFLKEWERWKIEDNN
jgi:hypothetical protein